MRLILTGILMMYISLFLMGCKAPSTEEGVADSIDTIPDVVDIIEEQPDNKDINPTDEHADECDPLDYLDHTCRYERPFGSVPTIEECAAIADWKRGSGLVYYFARDHWGTRSWLQFTEDGMYWGRWVGTMLVTSIVDGRYPVQIGQCIFYPDSSIKGVKYTEWVD